MPATGYQLNRFERVLFRTALVLGIVIVAVRVGALATLWCFHR